MRGILAPDGDQGRCEVTFEGVGDFLDAYRSSLSYGGLFVPGGTAPALTPMRVTLHLPLASRALELKGTVVLSRPDGIALDLKQTSASQWPELDAFGRLCEAAAREHLSGATPHTAERLELRPAASVAPGPVRTFDVAFPTVGGFIARFYGELSRCQLHVVAAPAPFLAPSVGAEIELRIHPPGCADAIPVLARIVGTRGSDLQLSLTDSARFRISLDAHVRRCEEVWRRITREETARDDVARPLASTAVGDPSDLPDDPSFLTPEYAAVPRELDLIPSIPIASFDDLGEEPLDLETLTPPVEAPPAVHVSAPAPTDEPLEIEITPDLYLPPRRSRAVRPRVEADVAPDLHGDLKMVPLIDLLRTLYLGKESGVLVLARADRRTSIRFDGGRITHINEIPERPDLRLPDLLLAQGLITPAQKDEILAWAQRHRTSFARALLERRLLSEEQVVTALTDQLKRKLLVQSTEPWGRFTFRREAAQPSSVSINPVAGLYQALRDRYASRPAKQIEAEEAEFAQLYVCRRPERGDATELELDRGEQRLWSRGLSGQHRVRDLPTVSSVGGQRQTHGVLWALRELGYLTLERQMGEELRLEMFRQKLDEKLERLATVDHFSALDLHWSAMDEEVTAAHQRLRGELSWRRHARDAQERIKLLSDQAVKLLDVARETLSTPRSRRNYRLTFLDQGQIDFAAELLIRQGDAAAYRGDLKQASDRYLHSLELVPHQPAVSEKLKSVRLKMMTVAGL